MKEQFGSDGGEVIASTQKELTVFLKAGSTRWEKVIKEARIRAE